MRLAVKFALKNDETQNLTAHYQVAAIGSIWIQTSKKSHLPHYKIPQSSLSKCTVVYSPPSDTQANANNCPLFLQIK